MSLNESIVEDAALEWFLLRQGYGGQVGELGYSVGHGPEMAPGEAAAERDSFGEMVQTRCARPLTPALSFRPSPRRSGSQREKEEEREAIRRLNPAIPEEAREEGSP